MSVLIKGMEMPESCYYCPFADGEWGYSPPHKMKCIINGKEMPLDDRTVQGNQLSCPLIEVPPHGRLIDADYLTNTFNSLSENYWNKEIGIAGYFKEIADYVDGIPSVIEAEDET